MIRLGGRNLLVIIYRILSILLVISLLIYITLVFREKHYLKQNIIILDNKNISTEDISEVDISEFTFQGIKARTGDEVKIETDANKYKGTIIGIEFDNKLMHIITTKNEIKKIKIGNIENFKMLNKYGSFFS